MEPLDGDSVRAGSGCKSPGSTQGGQDFLSQRSPKKAALSRTRMSRALGWVVMMSKVRWGIWGSLVLFPCGQWEEP